MILKKIWKATSIFTNRAPTKICFSNKKKNDLNDFGKASAERKP